MTVTVSSFRQDFPEFSDSSAFPDAQVSFYISLATKLMRAESWGDVLDYGTSLFVAHNLALFRSRQSQSSGSLLGGSVGVLSSKSVDSLSASFDTSASTIRDAGHWNLTQYGIQYYQLQEMFGLGGIQL